MVNNGKISLALSELLNISGGNSVGVCTDDFCCKPEGTFEPLEGHLCTNRCKDCWHLKHNGGFYCDA